MQLTRVIANPAILTLILALIWGISTASLNIAPAGVAFAQPTESQGPLAIEGPTTVEFPENSTVAITTYQATNAAPDSTLFWSIDGTDARRLSVDASGALHFSVAKDFERPNDGNRDNEYEIDLSVTDGSTHAWIEVIVRVTNVNEPPAFELERAEFSIEENASTDRRVGGALVVVDPDDGDSVTFSVEGEDADAFHIDAEGQIRVRRGAVLDYEASSILSLTALVTDQDGLTDSLTVQISLTDADDPGTVTFSSDRPSVGVPFTATVYDQDGVGGRIQWRWHRAKSANDEFEQVDGATRSSYTPVENDEGYVLRATASYEDYFEVGASASQISAAVGKNAAPKFESASVTLTVSEEAPAGTEVGDPVLATDSDGDNLTYALSGEDMSYFEVNESTGQIRVDSQALPNAEIKAGYTVTVTATNEEGAAASITVIITVGVSDAPPVITGPESVTHAENETTSVATYTGTDPDGKAITWDIAGTDEARFEISTTGELSFSSAPDYENPRDADRDNLYEVTVAASDGNVESTLAVEVTVTNINEAASIDGPASITYPENGSTTVATFTATDPDGDGVTWSIAGTDAQRFSINVVGELSFSSAPDYENPRDANRDNVYGVTVTASDGNLESTLDIEVTVSNVNEAASINGPTSISYPENGTAPVGMYSMTDPEGDDVTWYVAGTDAARFQVSAMGELTFRSAPDYEDSRDANQDNVYEVRITASDGNLESTLDVEVTVTYINEVVSIDGRTSVAYPENDTATVATYSAVDPEGNGVTWGVAGTDAARFAIGVAGQLTFNSPPDYENPRDTNTDNVYEVTVTASDGNLERTLDVEVTVTNINEAASIDGPTSITYPENASITVATFAATDPDGDGVTWGIAGADAQRFSINLAGELSFSSAPDYERPGDANKDNVYEVMITASDGNLTARLDVKVTVANVAEAILITGPTTVSYPENNMAHVATYTATDRDGDEIAWGIEGTDITRFSISGTGELMFNSPPDYERPRDANKDSVYEVTVTASDGKIAGELDVEITVTNVAEARSIEGSTSITYPENSAASVATYKAIDSDGDEIAWDIEGTDITRFSISGTGELKFNSPPDYENPHDANVDNVYEVTVTASDGNLTGELEVEITITNVNEAPSIEGSTTISYPENGTTSMAIYAATDPDSDGITWGTAGTDGAWFEISGTGELSFNSAPDYENPHDVNNDNVYEVTVTASDGSLTAEMDVEVTVTNVDEPPLIAGPVSISYAENSSDSVAEYTLVDPDGGDDTATGLEVAGTDATHFAIDNLGSLTFVTSPNFENPLDADSNNAYLLRIVWDSDGNENSLDVVVDVTDVNDAPRFPSTAVVAEIPENSCPGAHTLYRGIEGNVDAETDEDGDPLTYELSGPDAQAFVIHPPTGYVTLGPGTLLDFETSRRPFMLQVSVSDRRDALGNIEGEFNADDHLDLSVMVTDVDEPPVFTEAQLVLDVCGGPLRHEPDQLQRSVTAGTRGGGRVGAPLSAADPEGKPVGFMMVSQSDQGAFTIDETSGHIMVAPDFSPRDARRVYTLRVAATDGELESHIEVRISVAKAPKPVPNPDDDDSSTSRPDSSNNVEVSKAVPSNETLDNSATLDENATDSVISAGILDQPAVGLKQVEPVFVPVPRAAQTQLFGRSEVQDQTGRARFTAPAGILAVPYQVRLTQDEDACALLDGINPRLGCLSVSLEFFDMAGEPLARESLNRPGLLEIVLKTQIGSGDIEARGERAGISNKSFALMMRLDDGQEWGNTQANLREVADGSSILIARVRAPGQYIALVTEPGAEMGNRDSVAPLVFGNVAGAAQTQNTVIESTPERAVSLVYSPVAPKSQSQPVTVVSAEARAWQTLSLLIALLLDVIVALSAGIFLYRFTFRPH